MVVVGDGYPSLNEGVAGLLKKLLDALWLLVPLATLSGLLSVLLHRLHSVWGKFDIDDFHFIASITLVGTRSTSR